MPCRGLPPAAWVSAAAASPRRSPPRRPLKLLPALRWRDVYKRQALPRVRDFRGINGNSFDGRGNYSCGVKEQLIFPEIDYDKIDAVRGMDICFVTTAKTDEEAKELLKALGAPFAN